jgi:hypothetical protein
MLTKNIFRKLYSVLPGQRQKIKDAFHLLSGSPQFQCDTCDQKIEGESSIVSTYTVNFRVGIFLFIM